MYCKTCDELVEPQYEQIGECENCYANDCGGIIGSINKETVKNLCGEEALELTVSDLILNPVTENRLSNIGILFIKDLIKKSEEELASIKGFGRVALREIKERLQTLGLTLKIEEESQLRAIRS
ncbi:MAG: hypothetical protein NTV36_00670 [Candidatus Staskawiczbacteria bacterium]|nr:hypothetical protein [Candidatus Staskawiczbacteria bacterium]